MYACYLLFLGTLGSHHEYTLISEKFVISHKKINFAFRDTYFL